MAHQSRNASAAGPKRPYVSWHRGHNLALAVSGYVLCMTLPPLTAVAPLFSCSLAHMSCSKRVPDRDVI
eukprot:6739143-Prorocentrum_lima.AAC.1